MVGVVAKYQRYAEYKDSGVEWLGKVPTHWNIKRIKETAQIINGYPFDSEKFDPINGTPLVRIRDINSNETQVFFNGFVPKEALIFNSDILIGMDGDFNVSQWKGGEAALNQRVCCLRSNDTFLTKFLSYLLPTRMKIINDLTYFTTVKHLSSTDILKTVYAIPNKIEYANIANFLDYETAKIDSLIEKQQQLIELLKEKRQAVISHAVTKGLNPNVMMKDSGVEWLGQVPEHWGITKLKWKALTTSGSTPTTSKYELYYENGNIPWIRTTDLNNSDLYETPISITSKAVNDTACSILPINSILIAMYGGAGSIGKHALLKFESTINQAVCGVLPSKYFNSDYLHRFYEFYRPFWMIGAMGTRKDPNIGQDHIKEATVLLPPLEEQEKIAKYILDIQIAYDNLTNRAEAAIQLMQERRTALISAAVTGKIDVRNWQNPTEAKMEFSA